MKTLNVIGDVYIERPELTRKLMDEAIQPKREALSSSDIIGAPDVNEPTFRRRVGDPRNKL